MSLLVKNLSCFLLSIFRIQNSHEDSNITISQEVNNRDNQWIILGLMQKNMEHSLITIYSSICVNFFTFRGGSGVAKLSRLLILAPSICKHCLLIRANDIVFSLFVSREIVNINVVMPRANNVCTILKLRLWLFWEHTKFMISWEQPIMNDLKLKLPWGFKYNAKSTHSLRLKP